MQARAYLSDRDVIGPGPLRLDTGSRYGVGLNAECLAYSSVKTASVNGHLTSSLSSSFTKVNIFFYCCHSVIEGFFAENKISHSLIVVI